MRRIGVLLAVAADDAQCQARFGAFLQALARNWAGPMAATCGSTPAGRAANADSIRTHAAELVALAPDVILAAGRSYDRRVAAGDPHGADRVRSRSPIRSALASSASLARPGGQRHRIHSI